MNDAAANLKRRQFLLASTADLSPGPASGLGADWPDGFFCPCHGSKHDLAGRVFKDMPAPRNLSVPRYAFAGDTRLTIGADEHGSQAEGERFQ